MQRINRREKIQTLVLWAFQGQEIASPPMETRETKRWDDNLVVVQRNGQGAEKSI